MHRFLQAHADYVGRGWFQGRLYRVGDFPGMIESQDGNYPVRGEVYQLQDPETVFPELDRYEACSPMDPEPTLFKRRRREIRVEGLGRQNAWVYLFNHPVASLPEIPSGDFLKPEQ